jgi:hypothetical protein
MMQPVSPSASNGAKNGKTRIREVINFLNDFNAMVQSPWSRCGISLVE